MAKDKAELQALAQPQSRNEKYLNYIAGRAVDLNLLPDPQSRIEEYLEYLCYNRGAGGGGGQPFNGVTNVQYNAQTKQLVVTHSNGLITNLNLSNLSDVTDVQYNDNTHIMTVTRNGVPSEIDLSKLNTKINNVNPVDGNTQVELKKVGDEISLTVGGQDFSPISLADYLKDADTTNVGGQPNADKIVKLGADGKLSETMIPDLAITSVNNVASTQEALNKVQGGSIQVGDVVVVAPNNEIYMYNGANGVTFEDNFIQLSLGDGTVKVVNEQRPSSTGRVTVESQHIPYDNATSNLNATDVKGAIDEINGKFVSNVRYEATNRSLHQTKNGQEQEIVAGLVTQWKDLDHVEKYNNVNLMEYNKKISGRRYGAGDTYVEDASWSVYFLDVELGKQYSVIGKTNNNNRFVYTETVGGVKVDAFTVNSVVQSNGFYIMSFTVPTSNNRIKKVAISFEHDRNTINDMMIFEGVYNSIDKFVPYADKKVIQIETGVSYAFNNEGTNIKSTTVESAIKEVNEKIANAGGGTVTSVNTVQPVNGDVTIGIDNIGTLRDELNNRILQSELTNVGGNAQYEDKIPQLGADGKLSETMIPDLAITRVITTDDRTTAEGLVTNGQIHVGDVVVLTQDSNKVYMYNGNTHGDFENKFIELSLGDGTVKVVNGQRPTNTGIVTIDASQINLQADTTTVQEELDKKVERWEDLEYITEYKITNIFNKDLIIDGQCYHANGATTYEADWCRYEIPCEVNDVISVAKKFHDSQVFTYLDSDGNKIANDAITRKDVNGWKHYIITVPNNPDIKKVSINIHKPTNPIDGDSIMIYKGNGEPTTEYYPFANGYNVIVDGSKVALTFDPTGSNLTSTTTCEAIKELDSKIINAGGGTVTSVNGVNPNPQGEVTINSTNINTTTSNQNIQQALDNKVNTSEVGNEANKIPRIDGTGKLDTSIMPDLAITDVYVVNTEAEMMNLNVQKGDVVVVGNGPQHQNQTFMCKNHTATTQNDKFIAINMGYPVVKKINNIFPDQVGAMTLNATHIDCTINNDTKSTQVHLSNIGNGLRNVDQRVTNNTNRISALENRKLTVQAGDIITTIKNNGDAYTVGGATFLHCGIRKTISRAQYPQLADALGIPTGTNNFEYPYIQDANLNYDNGQRNATRRTYICAHVR